MRRLLSLLFLAAALVLTACADRVIHTRLEGAEWVLAEERAAVLPDGTAVDLWRRESFTGWNSYRLSDGTELLEEDGPIGPEDVTAGGVDNFGQLGEAAQTAIGAYYEDQGLLYDLQAELERAYGAYLDCQSSGEDFQAYIARQEVFPTASNDRIICFTTSVTLSVQGARSNQGRVVEETRLSAVFDRETGEKLETMSLFTVPQEEVLERLFSAAQIYDSALREEMKAAWDPAWLAPDSGGLSVYFPRGSLPSQETAYGFSVDCEDVRDILHDWAVPQPPAQ